MNSQRGLTASNWHAEVSVADSVTLPPDPHVMEALGGNHRLETAVADLVDNSIDATASKILIRFIVADNRIESFYVIDNGRGIPANCIDEAMTVGGVREYGETDLGHFGVGLKAASFSQANSLTVMSVSRGSRPVGRRWLASKASNSFECDIVADDFCAEELSREWGFLRSHPGTVVRWDDIRVFPNGHDAEVTSRFLQDCTTRLQHHLGMVFHRFLEQRQIEIGIDVEDVGMLGTGPVVPVQPVNPFGYLRPGAAGYPKELHATLNDSKFVAVCHIWPGRSQQSEFRLSGATPEQYQGLYFYRRRRLLQAGGWNNVEVQRRELQLARVVIDLDNELVKSRIFRMNPEKSKVETGPEFASALDRAVAADQTTFKDYIEEAVAAFKRANQRVRARAAVVPLGRGVPPRVRRVVEQELNYLPGYDDVDIRWTNFPDDVFFDVDRDNSTIWLNSRYRRALLGEARGSINDAPLVKTLVYLLTEGLFHGSYMGAKDRDNLDLWQTLLTAAAQEEG
ncbi:ATP-binding protein [Blastococcus sp. SYSU DS0539]